MSTAATLPNPRPVNIVTVVQSNHNHHKNMVDSQHQAVLEDIYNQLKISFGQHVKTSNINFSIITPDPSNQTIDQIIQVLTKVNNNKPKVVQAKIQETVIYACNGKNSITIRGLIPTYN